MLERLARSGTSAPASGTPMLPSRVAPSPSGTLDTAVMPECKGEADRPAAPASRDQSDPLDLPEPLEGTEKTVETVLPDPMVFPLLPVLVLSPFPPVPPARLPSLDPPDRLDPRVCPARGERTEGTQPAPSLALQDPLDPADPRVCPDSLDPRDPTDGLESSGISPDPPDSLDPPVPPVPRVCPAPRDEMASSPLPALSAPSETPETQDLLEPLESPARRDLPDPGEAPALATTVLLPGLLLDTRSPPSSTPRPSTPIPTFHFLFNSFPFWAISVFHNPSHSRAVFFGLRLHLL